MLTGFKKVSFLLCHLSVPGMFECMVPGMFEQGYYSAE